MILAFALQQALKLLKLRLAFIGDFQLFLLVFQTLFEEENIKI